MPRAGDKELPKINLNTFVGGESVDLKNGIAGSHQTSLAMDFRQKASQMTIMPGLRNIATNTELSDLPLCMEQDLNGFRYACGDLGFLYEIDLSDNVTSLGQIDGNGSAGMFYSPQNDYLYVAGQTTVSLYGQATETSPTLNVGHFGPSASVAPSVIYTFNTTTSSYDGGTVSGVTTQRNNLNTLTVVGITPSNYAAQVTHPNTGTYTPLHTLAETAGNFTAFIPDIEPFYGVAVYIPTVGTGNLTLTMHDSMNNNLGAVTIAHASIISGWNLFTFASPGVRAFVNAIQSPNGSTGYHFHLTTSTASGETMVINTITSSDITGCNFVLFANRLVETRNGWHPMCTFGQYLCIVNGNYLSTYNFGNDNDPNNSQWVRHQLFFDVGFEGTGICNAGQYVVVTAGRTSTVGNRQYQGGYIYYWDGTNQSYVKVPVAMGIPYSPFCQNGVVYFYCNGSLFAYVPGSSSINKVRYIGYQNTDFLNVPDTTVINPNMMASRYNLLMMGYPTTTSNPNLNMGIYTWGAVELVYPNSFGRSFLDNGGHETCQGGSGSGAWTDYHIGMIENFVDQMYMASSYVDHNGTTQYKLDLLDNTCGVAPKFNFAPLMWDGGARYKLKKGMRFKTNFTALPEGITVTPYYKLDRGTAITADAGGNSYAVVGDGTQTQAFINVPAGSRFHELEVGFMGTATGTILTSPAFTGLATEIDSLDDEPDLRPDG